MAYFNTQKYNEEGKVIERTGTGKRFTFFSREIEVKGVKTTHTDKSVFGSISEAIKVGEEKGKPLFEYEQWSAVFCGKAYEKALTLTDKDRIEVFELSYHNPYNKNTKRTYPSITITDFDIITPNGADANTEDKTDENGFMEVDPESLPDFLKD